MRSTRQPSGHARVKDGHRPHELDDLCSEAGQSRSNSSETFGAERIGLSAGGVEGARGRPATGASDGGLLWGPSGAGAFERQLASRSPKAGKAARSAQDQVMHPSTEHQRSPVVSVRCSLSHQRDGDGDDHVVPNQPGMDKREAVHVFGNPKRSLTAAYPPLQARRAGGPCSGTFSRPGCSLGIHAEWGPQWQSHPSFGPCHWRPARFASSPRHAAFRAFGRRPIG